MVEDGGLVITLLVVGSGMGVGEVGFFELIGNR